MRRILFFGALVFLNPISAKASTSQADTLKESCKEYVRFELGKGDVDQFKVGYCFGVILTASDKLRSETKYFSKNFIAMQDPNDHHLYDKAEPYLRSLGIACIPEFSKSFTPADMIRRFVDYSMEGNDYNPEGATQYATWALMKTYKCSPGQLADLASK